MYKENKKCASRRGTSADDLKRQRLYELVEEALESMVENGRLERRFDPKSGKRQYRLKTISDKQPATVAADPLVARRPAERCKEECNE
jgi:hypothetical protein